ncbi:hypothetical protein [Thermoactinospora rubra]|uniref:hypothetical protein n=1 Tax=Thermoactinospora rubra TaxID=1088767 RepID=UPI00117DABB1|nr:hypothetical protein [Thermoactinospora rubra]
MTAVHRMRAAHRMTAVYGRPVARIGVAAAAALLAAGCAPAADPPFVPSQATPVASASVRATPAIETIRINPEMSVSIEWPAGTDTTLVQAFTDLYVSSWRAVLSGDETYLDMVEPPATGQAHAWVRGFGSAKVRGSARLYALRVTAVMGDGARVDACVDETGVRLVSPRGRESRPSWAHAPYLQAAVLHRARDGVWRVKDFRHDLKGCA